MRLFTFLLPFCLASCSALPNLNYTARSPIYGTTRIIPVFVDREFSPAEDAAIADGLAQWNYAMNGQIRFELVSLAFDDSPAEITQAENGLMIMPVGSDCTFIPRGENPIGMTAAWTRGEHELFIVRDRINGKERLRGIVLHELGHILGAPDLHGIGSLMDREHADGSCRCIDQKSAELVAEAQGLAAGSVNYCQ
jgi:hypothetical protein